MTDFENVATSYTFDAQDRLKMAVTPEGTTTYSYFADGLARATSFFDGTNEGRCYDDAGRLTALLTTTLQLADGCQQPPLGYLSRHQYSYDADGNRQTQVEELTVPGATAAGNAETTQYGYDDESRLVAVAYPDNTTAMYRLDAVGNRVGERKVVSSLVPALTAAAFMAMSPAALSQDVTAVFNRADWLESVTDAVTPAKNATFEWDAAGNLTRQRTSARDRRFSWDVKQTLTRVEDNGVEAGRYDYGADGLRSKRVTATEAVEYVLDGMQVLVETDGRTSSHAAKRRYHYASAALAVTDIAGAMRVTRALHLDALGSPTSETTATGGVTAVRQYDAWGQYRNGTAPGSSEAKYGYTGHQYDVETGLVYARARYYDSEYGRFLSRDSFPGDLTSPMSLHRFTYAHGNPMRYTDPSGRCIFAGLFGQSFGQCVEESIRDIGTDFREVKSFFTGEQLPDERVARPLMAAPKYRLPYVAPATQLRAGVQTERNRQAVLAETPLRQRADLEGWQREQTGYSYYLQNVDNPTGTIAEQFVTEASQKIGGHKVGMALTGESYSLQQMSLASRIDVGVEGGTQMVETAAVVGAGVSLGARGAFSLIERRLGFEATFDTALKESFAEYGAASARSSSPVLQYSADTAGWFRLGELDALGRPTGGVAELTPEMIGTGTEASRSIRPPGFLGGGAGHARGHLLGAQLGGPGNDPRNLVTLFQTPVNSPVMRDFERTVRLATEARERVRYSVTPIYMGTESVPRAVTLSAQGARGFSLDVSVLNVE